MKKTVIVLSLLIAGMNVNAQQQIVERAKDIANDVIGVFTPRAQTPGANSKGFPGYEPTNPDGTGEDVPIVESILGLLGFGGVYAWRLIKRKREE